MHQHVSIHIVLIASTLLSSFCLSVFYILHKKHYFYIFKRLLKRYLKDQSDFKSHFRCLLVYKNGLLLKRCSLVWKSFWSKLIATMPCFIKGRQAVSFQPWRLEPNDIQIAFPGSHLRSNGSGQVGPGQWSKGKRGHKNSSVPREARAGSVTVHSVPRIQRQQVKGETSVSEPGKGQFLQHQTGLKCMGGSRIRLL